MLRIVNYNIHSGRDMFWRKRLKQMAETLRTLDADIIALQEVHENSRVGFQATFFARELAHSFAHGPALTITDGSYGNALLTRLPILDCRTTPLPAKKEPRALLQLTLHCGPALVDVWVAHFSLDRRSRQQQFAWIGTELEKRPPRPLILLGDFNTTAPSLPPGLRDCARERQLDWLPTLIPFRKRIDYVFVTGDWEVLDYRLIDVRWSDHYPLVVTLRLLEQPVVPAQTT